MFKIINVNGLTVIFSSMKNFSTAGIGIFVRGGARYEKKGMKGIAHFTEHMLFKGTKKYSYKEIKREIEGRGGSLNGYTSQEIVAYYAQFLKKNLEITLDILMEMVTNALFDQNEIEKERNVILEELKMYNDLPHFRALTLLDKALWEGHPLGEDVIGTSSAIKNITKNDFIQFVNNFYLPARICVCCVGDISVGKMSSLLHERMKPFKMKSTRLCSSPPSPVQRRKIIVETKPLDQTHLCLGFRGVSYRSKLRFIEELLHVIMGANMSSRFFEEIREKRGLCYDISTDTKKYMETGAFIIHCGLDEKNVPTASKSILRELKKIKEKKVTYKELERAKDYLLGQLSMSLERPSGRLFYLADSYMARGKINTFSQIEKKVRRIEREDILAFAQKLLNFNKMCISCVGNINKELDSQLEKIIKNEVG